MSRFASGSLSVSRVASLCAAGCTASQWELRRCLWPRSLGARSLSCAQTEPVGTALQATTQRSLTRTGRAHCERGATVRVMRCTCVVTTSDASSVKQNSLVLIHNESTDLFGFGTGRDCVIQTL